MPDAAQVANAGIWAVVGGMIAGAISWIIRMRPKMTELRMNENAQLREERRQDYKQLKSDYVSLKSELEALKASEAGRDHRLALMEQYSAASTLRFGQLEFVFRMVMDELEQISPNNPVARRATDLLAALMPLPEVGDDEMRERVQIFSRTFRVTDEVIDGESEQ